MKSSSHSDLKNDFLFFNWKAFGNDNFQLNNFYDMLNNDNNSKFVFKWLNSEDFWVNFSKKSLKKLAFQLPFVDQSLNFSYSDFKILKNKEDVLKGYILLIFLHVFSQTHFREFHKIDNDDKDAKFLSTSDDLINLMVEYFEHFYIFCWSFSPKNEYLNNNAKLHREFFTKFLITCEKFKILDEKLSKFKGGKTPKMYKFLPFEINCPEFFSLNTVPFKIIEVWPNKYYSIGSHFTAIFICDKPNSFSGESYQSSFENHEKLTNRFINIDIIQLNNVLNDLLEDSKILKCNIESNFLSLKKALKTALFEENSEMAIDIQKNLSLYENLRRWSHLLTLNMQNKNLFLPHSTCFRGRIYQLTGISYTFYKEIRYAMYVGHDTNDKIHKTHPLEFKFEKMFKESFSILDIFDWFRNLKLEDKEAIVWIFISIGALKKMELGKRVHFREFLKKGISLFSNSSILVWDDVYEKIEFKYLIFLISEIQNNSTKRWIFHKDATASCFQHLIKILGHANEMALKICNLNSDEEWCDPYTYLIDDFFEKNTDKFKNLTSVMIKKYFNRKTLKSTIMTESYGAKNVTCWSRFKLKISYINIHQTHQDDIKKAFFAFFNYLIRNSLLFPISSKNIILEFESQKAKIRENKRAKIGLNKTIKDDFIDDIEVNFHRNTPNAKINLNYKKVTQKRLEIVLNNKRYVKSVQILIHESNNGKFYTAIRPNYVHLQDSALIWWYILETGNIGIHDTVSCDFREITYTVCKVNEGMNIIFHDLKLNKAPHVKFFSIFIVL